MGRPIRVIDKRTKHYFVVDDVYLNGYAKHLGPIPSMVYISLCRHVDREQNAFPSQEMIAIEIGAKVRSVKNAISLLKQWNLIEVERVKTEYRWARNSYYLLDKTVWEKPSGASSALDGSGAKNDIDQGHVVHTKDTHIKDTHITPSYSSSPLKNLKKYSSIEDITDNDLIEISEQYRVPLGLVKLQLEKMGNWMEAKGKSYKNYKKALKNWVLSEAQRVVEKPKKGGVVDGTYL